MDRNIDEVMAEFNEKHIGVSKHAKIHVVCKCGNETDILRFRLEENLKRNGGEYLCRSCAQKACYERNPYITGEVRQKISQSNTGKTHSEGSKDKMSVSKKELYQTEKGPQLKKDLSIKAAKQHSKGDFKHAHIRGYFPSIKNDAQMFYGSSYELRCIFLLENDDNVVRYLTQIAIEINGRGRCLDIIVYYKDGRIEILEVKPVSRLNEDAVQLQIQDSRDFALANKMEFSIWTEDFSGFRNEKEIIRWAEKYVLDNLQGIDFAAIRRNGKNEVQKRYYANNIKDNKVEIYCGYCDCKHEIMKATYEGNLKRNNGRYICHNENAHKPKPKKKKVNPYESEGKKQCLKCEQIKLFEAFSTDPSRSDGYCSNCKECRKLIANQRNITKQAKKNG